ncbi:OmpP1/FadL family transporter [Candidatus Nitrotoga sp. HW29]|uniref:OmpP1/FadL family transporter n=1 Tax=Candidatus Nitrotoga sp. HW29 TaxID=2886963 RepID=UPI001EF16CC9|nr:outer membrane protein transport protein [Candidatus Nitrotoga sp. HW29]
MCKENNYTSLGTALIWAIGAVLAGVSGSVAASGFALIEQNASGLGNAYAGGAAVAEDASTIFFNPAGMSRLSGKQIVVAAHAIQPSAKFIDSASIPPSPVALHPTSSAPGDAGSWQAVPNGYFTMEINPQMRFGLGVNAPFGMRTEYPAGWVGRFQALESSVRTINVNPSLSYRVNENFSIGAGLNYQHITAYLSNALNLGTTEGMTAVSGNDSAWGYNLGGLYEISSSTRIGVAYRSSLKYKLNGTALITDAAGGALPTYPTGVTANIKTPDTLSVSFFSKLDSHWDVMADISRTSWNKFSELRVVKNTGALLGVAPENWSNTWRAAVGGNYHFNEHWTVRGGVAYDQSPISDAFRTARIPGNDRTWLSVGGQYKPGKDTAFDFGYAHLFLDNASINNNTGAAGTPSTATVGNLVGAYNSSVNILSVQYTHSF